MEFRLLGEIEVLAAGRLLDRRHAGYVLDIDPGLIDLHRFGHLSDQGRDPSHSDAERASALAEALGLWQGDPVAGLSGEW